MKDRVAIPLRLIDDNPWQPRAEMDREGLEELANSIGQVGLLQSPLVRLSPSDAERYELAFGHRRVAACRLLFEQGGLLPDAPADLGEPHIEADVVADLSDEDMAIIALTENQRRKDLSQIEVARAHKRAIEETDLTVQSWPTGWASTSPP